MPRYLTKTRFAVGCQCETKLFYTGKRNEYADSSLDDPFLAGLAEGGFQVGELARVRLCRDPVADVVRTLDPADALRETAARLQADDATVAEAAFAAGNLFIRVDILHKRGRVLELYEVKSKSWEPGDLFWQKRDPTKPDGGWLSYLLDVAFQKYVLVRACPRHTVKAFLVLVDKTATASVDGLNQLFKVRRRNGRAEVRAEGVTRARLGADILACVPVDADVDKIWNLPFPVGNGDAEASFEALVARLASLCQSGRRSYSGIGAKCRGCEFVFSRDPAERRRQRAQGLRSGRDECWKHALGKRFDADRPTVLEIWNFRKADEMIRAGKPYMADLAPDDLGDGRHAWRQRLQVEMVRQGRSEPWLDRDELAEEIAGWKYPLHFIDFETSRVAIPFHKGRRPYEQIAFQFSHHAVQKDGRIVHAGQWLEAEPGRFPNFDFVRALKKELDRDGGSIFCYAHHENTVLNEIAGQLEASAEPDRRALCAWIRTVTRPPGSKPGDPRPARCLVDMREVLLRCHYDPQTRGSNSLKAVLPAIIRSSSWLRKKYGQSVYGTPAMPSLNYRDWTWIRPAGGNDPYRTLPPLFTPEEQAALSEYLANVEEIAEGGEAMIAYAKLQFAEIRDVERARIAEGLLRYCELDTLAMVMLYEYWQRECAT